MFYYPKDERKTKKVGKASKKTKEYISDSGNHQYWRSW